jgi:hypothetical protein
MRYARYVRFSGRVKALIEEPSNIRDHRKGKKGLIAYFNQVLS